MMLAVEQAVTELYRWGTKLTVERGDIRVVFCCPRSAIPSLQGAIATLKEHKQEAVALLMHREVVDPTGQGAWPASSLSAQSKFGLSEARLDPFIGQRVRTPHGLGKLLQVFRHRATVLLDKELGKAETEQKAAHFRPIDICPPNVM
jgi:hypothetical protein